MRIFIPFLILSLLIESTTFPYPITLVLIIILAIGTGQSSLWWAFAAGLVLDFLAARTIGLSSLFYLLISFIIIRYQQKIYLAGKIYTLVFILFSTSLYSLLFYRSVTVISILISAVASFICLYISARLFPETIASKKKLSV